MPNFKPRWGNEADLPQLRIPGTLYATLDTHKLYLDLADGSRIELGGANRSIGWNASHMNPYPGLLK